MALSTIETVLVNDGSPINDMYSIGDRIRYLDTAGSLTGGAISSGTASGVAVSEVIVTETTADAATTGDHLANWGVSFCTGAGQYVIAPPTAGIRKTVVTQNVSGAFLQSVAATGDANPYFIVGASTYTVIEIDTADAANAIELLGVSTAIWVVLNSSAHFNSLGTAST
jgi:hypothetical protein